MLWHMWPGAWLLLLLWGAGVAAGVLWLRNAQTRGLLWTRRSALSLFLAVDWGAFDRARAEWERGVIPPADAPQH